MSMYMPMFKDKQLTYFTFYGISFQFMCLQCISYDSQNQLYLFSVARYIFMSFVYVCIK